MNILKRSGRGKWASCVRYSFLLSPPGSFPCVTSCVRCPLLHNKYYELWGFKQQTFIISQLPGSGGQIQVNWVLREGSRRLKSRCQWRFSLIWGSGNCKLLCWWQNPFLWSCRPPPSCWLWAEFHFYLLEAFHHSLPHDPPTDPLSFNAGRKSLSYASNMWAQEGPGPFQRLILSAQATQENRPFDELKVN